MLVNRYTVFEVRCLCEKPDGTENYFVVQGTLSEAMTAARSLAKPDSRVEVVYRDLPRRKDLARLAEFEENE